MRWDDEANKVAPSMDRKVLSINPDTGIPAYVNMGEMLEFISSNVQKGDPGFDAYEVWTMQPGNEGKTIEDYFIFLQSPAYEAGLTAVQAKDIAVQKAQEAEQSAAESFQSKQASQQAETGSINAANASVEAANLSIAAKNASEDARDISIEQAGIATTKAQEASTSAQNAATSDQSALASKNAAKASEDASKLSETNSSNSAAAALQAKNASETARDQSISAKNMSEQAKNDSQTAKTGAETAKAGSEAARDKAMDWSEKGEDLPVEPGKYSAKHYSSKAAIAYLQLPNTERAMADIIAHLLGRIETLEQELSESKYNSMQINDLSVVDSIKFKGADMILFGTGAPAVTPDFIGQFFVNTTGGITYQAKGIGNSGDWKQTSN